MSAWQDVRCPVCGQKLCEAFGLSVHVLIRIKCRCKRLVLIKEGFLAEVMHDSATASSPRD